MRSNTETFLSGSTDTYILKVASRCNLNCSYCYVYNLNDQSWRTKPKFMSEETVTFAARRMAKHTRGTAPTSPPNIIFHGGEPLLLPSHLLEQYICIINSAFENEHLPRPSLSMQTNGLLLDPNRIEVLTKYGVGCGVSMDGIPGEGDGQRVDHSGRPSGAKLDTVLRESLKGKFREIFGGILCCINLEQDPIRTYNYLSSFEPPIIDFRFPLRHYGHSFSNGSYAQWLTKIFNYIRDNNTKTPVAKFNGILQSGVGRQHGARVFGTQELSVCVIETDGALELSPSLKAIKENMTISNLSVEENTIEEYLKWRVDFFEKLNGHSIAKKCQSCSVLRFCGGGHHCHRFSESRGFDNPDIYCSDIKSLVTSIYSGLTHVSN